jgi:hypothetical protein
MQDRCGEKEFIALLGSVQFSDLSLREVFHVINLEDVKPLSENRILAK